MGEESGWRYIPESDYYATGNDDEDELEEEIEMEEGEDPIFGNVTEREKKVRITRPYISKFELANLINVRALDLVKPGTKLLLTEVEYNSMSHKSPYEVAQEEVKKVILSKSKDLDDYVLFRKFPNGEFEKWKLSELKITRNNVLY